MDFKLRMKCTRRFGRGCRTECACVTHVFGRLPVRVEALHSIKILSHSAFSMRPHMNSVNGAQSSKLCVGAIENCVKSRNSSPTSYSSKGSLHFGQTSIRDTHLSQKTCPHRCMTRFGTASLHTEHGAIVNAPPSVTWRLLSSMSLVVL